MAWTLQQLRADPGLLKQFTHRERVPCICGRCGTEHDHVKRVVEMAVAKGTQEHLFCTRSCSASRQGQKWDIRKGVPGRVCKVCGQWTPRDKLHCHQGWICASCAIKTPRGRFSSIRQRAKAAGISCTLTIKDILLHWQKPCTYCGSPIETIGLDRKDNTRGYEPDNVAPCCPACNWMKGEDPVDVFLARCARVAARHP